MSHAAHPLDLFRGESHPTEEEFREEMRAARGNDFPLFDKGGAIAELIARCEEDTGLAPPAPPVFLSWVQKDQAAE